MNFRLDDTSFEKAKITAAIAHTGGNIVQAAKLLGISERALWAKRKKYGLKYCTTSQVVYCSIGGMNISILFYLYHF